MTDARRQPATPAAAPRGPDLDAPETTIARATLLRRRAYLRRLYARWYRWIAERLPAVAGKVIEIGSGGGFIAEAIPGTITSDSDAIAELLGQVLGDDAVRSDGRDLEHALLEVATPPNPVLRFGHGVYFGQVVPRIGAALSDGDAYRYLPRSVAYLPEPDAMLAMLSESRP